MKSIIQFAVIFGLLSGAAHGEGLRIEFDPATDFSQYLTYTWAGCIDADTLVPVDDSSEARDIEAAVSAELRARRMIKVSQHAEALVSCVIGSDIAGERLLGIVVLDAGDLEPLWTAEAKVGPSDGIPMIRQAFAEYPAPAPAQPGNLVAAD